MQETIETKAGKTGMVKAEGRGEERRSRKTKETEESKNNGCKESS